MSTPQATPSGAGFGFSFMDLFTPKTAAPISFGDQPNQPDFDSDEATRKKSGLEAYTRRNKQSLPKDFSDQVIENEMDLEKDFVTLETVNKLTELYSLAMAFYESEGNHKYKYFANKLQDLLMKANVKEMMVRELAPSKKTKQDEQQIKRLRLENKISKINAEKEAFTVVKSQEYRDRELNKVLEKNIQSQKDRIKQRLAEKKARVANRAQSVTYLSDDNSSLPDDNIQDFEKELEDKARLNDIAEVDETRYNTPPRKRGKDGQMVFFEKGKAQKTFKFDFDEDKKKPSAATKGHTRRHSFHRENVVAVIAQKRTSRAQSFGNGKAPFPLEKLKPLNDDNKPITEKTDVEEQSAGFARKQTKNQTIVEDCNEDKNKSVNSIESATSKNQVEEIVVQDEKEPEHIQNVESAVFLDDDEEDHEHEEHEEQVIETEEIQVVPEESHLVAEENVQPEAEVQEVQVEEQRVTQPEADVQAEEVIETEETQPVVEETQVVPEEESAQPEAEVQEVQVEEQEVIQPEVETVVSEVQQEESIKEEEVTEAASEQIVEEVQVHNDQEETIQVPEEQVETEVKEEPKAETEEVIEENKVETEVVEEVKEQTEEKTENVEEVVEEVKEEKNIRRRTDSEVADEKKLALMRQIDAEQKELIDVFIQKQAQEREEVTKKIEEKFEQKIQNMKEDMDEDEIAGDMWQRALKKFNKDKETEINEALEKLGQEQAPEFDKYKKKLLQQKMFKLAELSDE